MSCCPTGVSIPPAICVPATRDEFLFMTRRRRYRLPTPPQMWNHGNFIISLGQLVPILGQEAEKLGVDVFAGFAAAEALFDEAGAVKGVRIGDMGVDKNGEPGPNFALGPEIHAKITMFCEGCRGSVSKQLIKRFKLDAGKSPQTYGLGFKEMWQLPPGRVQPGLIQHTLGWPLDSKTYGGSFLYHLDNDRVYVGFVVGLDYEDPRLKPFEAFQQYKNHPEIKSSAAGRRNHRRRRAHRDRRRLSIDADARNAGRDAGRRCRRHAQHAEDQGHPSGDSLRNDRGSALRRARHRGRFRQTLARFERRPRTAQGAQHSAGVPPRAMVWSCQCRAGDRDLRQVCRGRSPITPTTRRSRGWTITSLPDREWGERELPPRDRLAFVFFAATTHDENQPVHLHVADTTLCATRCIAEFGNPCTNFCPANVYEMIADGKGGQRLQINSSNCVHCKACDIKDPYAGQITWVRARGRFRPQLPEPLDRCVDWSLT